MISDEELLSLITGHRYIAVAGLIGSGKTTLATRIGKLSGAKVFFEDVDGNKFLPRYYAGHRVAFEMQMRFISARVMQIMDILGHLQSGGTVIQDRTIYEDLAVFSNYQYRIGQMTTIQFNQISQFYSVSIRALVEPDLVIWVKTPIESILQRIVERARPFEQEITTDFLEYLQKFYNKSFMRELKQRNILTVSIQN